MNRETQYERWNRVTNDGATFLDRRNNVELTYTKRPDLNAFILLDKISPGSSDILVAAEHDQIWLEHSEETVAKLTDEQILELSRCGVMFDESEDGMVMFV